MKESAIASIWQKKISSNLTDIVYLLESPLEGLHPHDFPLLLALLNTLVSNHNTVIATDRGNLLAPYAHHSLYLGPNSGPEGGFLCSPEETPLPEISIPPVDPSLPKLAVNLSIHHIQNLEVSAPLRSVVALAGVSGSGKTSLLLEGFYKEALRQKSSSIFSDILILDSHSLPSSQRSDISTYFDIAPHLRAFYASLTKAKALGISETMFSTNTKKRPVCGLLRHGLSTYRPRILCSGKTPVPYLLRIPHTAPSTGGNL